MSAGGLEVKLRRGRLCFGVSVKPRSSRSKLLGIREGLLSVALRAPPVDGEANAELVKLLAKQLGVSKGSVEIVSGESSRRKILCIEGLDESELRAKLSAATGT